MTTTKKVWGPNGSYRIACYKNGNYIVEIYSDGTKIREHASDSNGKEFIPQFAESIDLKITNYCDVDCLMCHESSTINGNHADLMNHPNSTLLSTIKTGTEVAIGGGNPLSHPNLDDLLRRFKSKGVIANITVNQTHFMKPPVLGRLHDCINNGLLYGIGISLTNPTKKFYSAISEFPNLVIHVINGYHSYKTIEKLFNRDLKLLVLGYKNWGRGLAYSRYKKTDYYNNIHKIMKSFKIISFDNLAIEQLDLERVMLQDEWNQFYMGDDGNYTFYLDLVKGEFAQNSFSPKRFKIFPLGNVNEMFNKVRKQT